MQLKDLTYKTLAPCGGYGDVVPPKHGGPSAKYIYLRDCKRFLRLVARELGWKEYKISANPGGFGVPGDAQLCANLEGLIFNVSLLVLYKGYAQVCWRAGSRPFAADGINNWIDAPSATPEAVGQTISIAT